jgi:hypothetical protein
MSPRFCKRCQRANPSEAVYCYNDGFALENHQTRADIPPDGSALDIGGRPFSVPFVFPSGRVCHNFNQLAMACCKDTDTALNLLRKGHLETFLISQGRGDLAAAAHTAAEAPDPQRGFDEFLGHLPALILSPAALRVEKTVIDLGTVRIGEDMRFELVLYNDGMRLLVGSASCYERPWLVLGDSVGLNHKSIQFYGQMALPIRIRGSELRAFAQEQEAHIQIESNGGNAIVVVRLLVLVRPFPEGVLAGAMSPRELAEKAREAPREAGALIESGAVARWYEANGWTYPVAGPPASGKAAVQQLFEALGLVKPPRVEISEDTIRLAGRPGLVIEYVVAVSSQENRAAVAHGTADQPWLQIGRTIYRGRSAILPLNVTVPDRPGETLFGQVTVAANGNQRFLVPVSLTVEQPPAPALSPVSVVPIDDSIVNVEQYAPPRMAVDPARSGPMKVDLAKSGPLKLDPARSGPMKVEAARSGPMKVQSARAEPASRSQPVRQRSEKVEKKKAPSPEPEAKAGRGRLLPFLLLGVLVLGGGGLLLGGRNLFPFFAGRAAKDKQKEPVPLLILAFQDDPNDALVKAMTMTFGLTLKDDGTDKKKRLTLDERGRTNNTCYRLDGKEVLLGDDGGTWERHGEDLGTAAGGRRRIGSRSVWKHQAAPVFIAQHVEIIDGPQSGKLDTCLVHYTIESRDTKPHKIGLRFLLDTFIGEREGVPFAIPGDDRPCDTSSNRQGIAGPPPGTAVPDFLTALETGDLASPGTVAHLGLRLGGRMEAPGRVSVGAWPHENLRARDNRARGNLTLFDVPVLAVKDRPASAVTIYWLEKDLAPGARREVGFTYGLGSIAGDNGQGRLGVVVGGAFGSGGELTVMAYVKKPEKGEKLTLELPPGLTLIGGSQDRAVPPLPADAASSSSLVTWRVRSAPGTQTKYTLHVRSTLPPETAGPVQSRTVTIKANRDLD